MAQQIIDRVRSAIEAVRHWWMAVSGGGIFVAANLASYLEVVASILAIILTGLNILIAYRKIRGRQRR